MTKIYIFRLGKDRPKNVALSRQKDWITGLSFTTMKPDKEVDGPYLTFSSEKLEQAGFVVRFDKARDLAIDVHTGQAPDASYNLPPTRFKKGHVTVYFSDMTQWDDWHLSTAFRRKGT
jgi:hypothetical protein